MEETFLDRLVYERDELSTKTDKLNSFIEGGGLSKVDKPQRSLLKMQLNAMKIYLSLLEERIILLTK